MSTQAFREDRIQNEALATQDIRRLCDLFGLSVKGAERDLLTLDHPVTHGDSVKLYRDALAGRRGIAIATGAGYFSPHRSPPNFKRKAPAI
ncbi:hypothetical protein [Pseudarthrobacter sulfonivorans]|uniref:hypothetical protein n=1 Tax=Pseudarthrobacter sulfonivorans TaxID=121292 RepID=UPI0012FE0F76|nr:hypothetical protein [Pseudarthrobacter sulfonivorans]